MIGIGILIIDIVVVIVISYFVFGTCMSIIAYVSIAESTA
jgi:hypothetical protein